MDVRYIRIEIRKNAWSPTWMDERARCPYLAGDGTMESGGGSFCGQRIRRPGVEKEGQRARLPGAWILSGKVRPRTAFWSLIGGLDSGKQTARARNPGRLDWDGIVDGDVVTERRSGS